MDAYVVVRRKFESEILRRLVPNDLQANIGFVEGGRLGATKSMASSIMSNRQKPVAIVVDADSLEPEAIEVRRQEIEDMVGFSATIPFSVILAVPQLEIVFFHAPSLLRRYFAGLASEESLERSISIGEFRSRHALQSLGLAPDQVSSLLDAATAEEIESMREAAPIRELSDFLRSARDGSLTLVKAWT